jgi:hypothetical protein
MRSGGSDPRFHKHLAGEGAQFLKKRARRSFNAAKYTSSRGWKKQCVLSASLGEVGAAGPAQTSWALRYVSSCRGVFIGCAVSIGRATSVRGVTAHVPALAQQIDRPH